MLDYKNMMKIIGIKNEVKVIDNFLPKDKFYKLQEFIMSDAFPWYRNSGVNVIGDGDRQFTHTFYNEFQKQSWAYDSIGSLIEAINPLSILRIKANLLPQTYEIHEFDYHVDYFQPCVTAILYVNNNNGYTRFESGKKISSVENRFVMFPSYMKHAGTTCTDVHDRVVINFNYYAKNNLW